MNSNAISIAAIIIALASIFYASSVSSKLDSTRELIADMIMYDTASAEAIMQLQDIAGYPSQDELVVR